MYSNLNKYLRNSYVNLACMTYIHAAASTLSVVHSENIAICKIVLLVIVCKLNSAWMFLVTLVKKRLKIFSPYNVKALPHQSLNLSLTHESKIHWHVSDLISVEKVIKSQ